MHARIGWWALLVGCNPVVDEPDPQPVEPVFAEAPVSGFQPPDPIRPLPASVSVSRHPSHPLLVDVRVTSPEATEMRVTVRGPGVNGRVHDYPAPASAHDVTLAGFRAQGTYTLEVRLTADGRSRTVIHEVTTGDLPFPEIATTITTTNPNAGITLLAVRDPSSGPSGARAVYLALDQEGEVVWYYRDTNVLAQAPLIRRAPDGINLFLTMPTEARLIDLEGNVLQSWFQESPDEPWHHDRRLLRDGHMVALANETTVLEDETVLLGDLGLEQDALGNEVGRWSSFATLDTTRFPGRLSRIELRGAIDWTHANGVGETPDDAGYIVSLRHQSWVVRVDRATGEVDWLLGKDGDFALKNGIWFNAPHAPLFVDEDEILVYDNGVERYQDEGGEGSRVVKYRLDEGAMTAEQVWAWSIPVFTPILGAVSPYKDQVFVAAGGRFDAKSSFFLVNEAGEVTWRMDHNGLVFQASMIDQL